MAVDPRISIQGLLVELPDGAFTLAYLASDAPTMDLARDVLADVVTAARSLNFFERVRPWDDLHRAMGREKLASVRVDERTMEDLAALRDSCAKTQRRVDRYASQIAKLPKAHPSILRRYVAPDASHLA
jgi:hypothetical protein